MRAAVVGKGAGVVHLADGDVLHRTRGEEVERNEFVVGIGRGDGQSVQGRGAVAVAQPAYDELARLGDGDARYLLHAFLHVADALDAHFLGTQILDGQGGFLAFHLQGTFTFQVLFGYDRNFAQGLCVGLHFEVQYRFAVHFHLSGGDVHIAHVAHGEVVHSVGHLQAVVAVDVGYGSRRAARHLDGSARQRFFRLFVCDGSPDGSCHDRHGRQGEEQNKEENFS